MTLHSPLYCFPNPFQQFTFHTSIEIVNERISLSYINSTCSRNIQLEGPKTNYFTIFIEKQNITLSTAIMLRVSIGNKIIE